MWFSIIQPLSISRHILYYVLRVIVEAGPYAMNPFGSLALSMSSLCHVALSMMIAVRAEGP